MSEYENETCERCASYEALEAGYEDCTHPEGGHDVHAQLDACEHFTPSLQCRQVRALEQIDQHLNMLQAVAQDVLMLYGKNE